MKDISSEYSPECKIMGQALTSLAVMNSLPGLDQLLEFLNQLINSFPGVAGNTICHRNLKHEIGFSDDLTSVLQSSLLNAPASEAHPDIENPDNPDRPVFTFKTTDRTFGFLVILIDKQEEYTKFSSIINNLVSIISIELDSREKKKEQEEYQDKLESKVKERTARLRKEIEAGKTLEKELRAKTEDLETAQQIAKLGSYKIDLRSGTWQATEEAKRILGIEDEPALKPMEWMNYIHPDSKKQIEKAFAGLFNYTDENFIVDLKIIRLSDKEPRWIRGSGKLTTNNNKEPFELIGTIQDITEYALNQEKLRVSEEKFANAFRNHPSAMQFLDAETGERIMVNKSLVEISGYTEEELLNKNAFIGGLAIKQKDIDSFVGDIRKKGMVRGNPTKIHTKDGGLKHILVSGTEIILDGRNTVLTSYQDITKLIEAEEELKKRQQLLEEAKETAESYLDIAAEIILKLDKKGDISLMNQSGHKLLGYKKDELIGKSWFKTCLPEEIRKEVKKMFSRIVEGDIENVRTFQNRVQCRSGEIKEILWHNTLLYDDQGNIDGVLCSGEDITAIINAEKELKSAFEQMRKMKEMVEQENVYLKQEVFQQLHFSEIIGEAKIMKKMLRQIELVAGTDSVVIITGETGTGKELIARAIHKNSKRKDKPLIRVNCPAIPNELIESEFFGHERGAFTGAHEKKSGRFEIAHKGTIFLDEIGDLPLNLQVKILRVLQEGEFERLGSGKSIKVDVRVIAASNRDLEELVIEGKFRQDLYFRLKVFPIYSPSLRERREDIPLLVSHFVDKLNTKMGRNVTSIPQKTMDKFLSYNWPGNVRELENIVERAMVISQGKILTVGNWLGENLANREMQNLVSLEELERNYITDILNKTMWRIRGPKGAANILGLKPTTLESRMKKLGIKR